MSCPCLEPCKSNYYMSDNLAFFLVPPSWRSSNLPGNCFSTNANTSSLDFMDLSACGGSVLFSLVWQLKSLTFIFLWTCLDMGLQIRQRLRLTADFNDFSFFARTWKVCNHKTSAFAFLQFQAIHRGNFFIIRPLNYRLKIFPAIFILMFLNGCFQFTFGFFHLRAPTLQQDDF